nr:MAG TPA: prohead serine protease [Caudoviricetes sp.]
MKNELIRRNYDFQIRAEKDEKRGNIIIGRPIVYGSKTDIGGMFEEVIEKGALKKTNLEDVRFLVNHDQSKIPLARSRRNSKNSTMQLSVDDEGMEIKVELDVENNTEARNLYSAIERGDITGMSFMFGINDEKWEGLDTEYPTRHILSISTVVEVSAVTFPAYEATSISARDKSAVETARLAVETARSKEVDTSLELEKLKLKYLLGGF